MSDQLCRIAVLACHRLSLSPTRQVALAAALFAAAVWIALAGSRIKSPSATERLAPLAPTPSSTQAPSISDRKIDMSFPGFPVICNDTVPPPYDGADENVVLQHRACCDGPGSVGSDGVKVVCRAAARQLRIPAANERAMRASGAMAVDLATVDFERSFTFVTGCSASHFEESLVQLNSIQKFFPCTPVLYWDLGLTQDQVTRLKSFCGLRYRRFDASKYPPHVAKLGTYAFKPLVIMESFTEQPVLWWVDSSIRFTSDTWRNVIPLVRERHGIIMFRDPDHSVWSTTYPQTYEYIGTDVEMLKRVVTVTGNNFIVVNTRDLFSTVLYWLYACVLDVRCIAPIMYPQRCDLKGYADFANCHRFDQSVLTILVANVWGFNSDGYRYPKNFFIVVRRAEGDNEVRRCSQADFEAKLLTGACKRS